MKMKQLLVLSGLAIILQISACSWVKITPEGEKVIIQNKDDIADCKKVGSSTVSLRAKVAGVKRKSETVATELSVLGRNAGARMGGDTIVADSEIENGEQTFGIYKCR